MSSISPPVRGKSWVFQVTALCIVLGMLLAFSLKTQRQAVGEGVPIRLPALRAEFRATKEQNVKLQEQIAELKKQVAAYESSENVPASLTEALKTARMMAGLVAVRGRGVIVNLHDSPKLDPSETRSEVIENYMIHDSDIQDIVKELFAAGAEAISVNDQRLMATSSIRCVGPVVLVNSVQIAPPYIIKAVGKPDVLEKALEMPGGVADVNGLFLLDMIEIKKVTEPSIVIPAYTGVVKFTEGREVPETTKKN